MNKIITSASLALALLAAAASAQETPRFGIGVAGTGQMPVGDLADFAGFGFGGLAGIEMGAYPGLAVTARSGYIRFMEKQDNTVTYIPIMGGVKASGADGAVYISGEVGAVITKQDYSGSNILEDDVNETNLGWNVGLGSMAGPLDLRLSFNVWDAAHMSESMTIGLSLGVTVFNW